MKSVISVISISTGGVIKLNRALCERCGIRKGDMLVVFKDEDRVTLQIQRGNKIILRLSDATIIRGR